MKNAKSIDPIPEEIIFEILTRLPVKSLCRFRCVSKLWLSIISDPHFVGAHYARSSLHPKLLISFPGYSSSGSATRQIFFSVDYPEPKLCLEEPSLVATFHGSASPPLPWFYQPTSLDGLLFFDCNDHRRVCDPSNSECIGIRICNPSTSECVVLAASTHVAWSRYSDRVCSGFDPVDKKFIILCSRRDNWTAEKETYAFTFVGTQWQQKKLDEGHPLFYRATCIDGVIYSTTEYPISNCWFMVAFDVNSETFQMIELPMKADEAMLVIKLGGQIALADFNQNGLFLCVLEDLRKQVWNCKKYAWPTEEYILDHKNVLKLFGVTHRDELLLAPTRFVNPFYLYFYKLEGNTVRRVEIRGIDEHLDPHNWERSITSIAAHHIETLRSPKDFIY